MSKCALCKTSLKDDEINVCDKCRLDFLNFKQQLAEKDKEIEEYKTQIKEFCGTKLAKLIDKKEQELRHQICNEIFKELQENVDCYFEERKCNSPHSQLPYIWFNEIRFRKFLNKIEQGEQAKESMNADTKRTE